MTKSERMWVRLDPADYEQIVLLAHRFGVSISATMRLLLKEQLRISDPATATVPGLYVPDPDGPDAAELDQVEVVNDGEAEA